MDKFDEMKCAREAATQAIINSTANKKLIVSGPGTGKTHLFKKALKLCPSKGLALTFIRNLVFDLKNSLGDVADVFTFHGFCKHQLYRHAVDGLKDGWDYYPHLLTILAHDLKIMGNDEIKQTDIENCLHDLDDSANVIKDTLSLGDHYNSVSHVDLVYRVMKHFERAKDKIPTYPLIVVDEYQDFSRLETSFIQLMAERSPVLIAGDDDQALYSFKKASAQYIRELANEQQYNKFELPFCSRCPQVIVDAVNLVIGCAQRNGNLSGRVNKSFLCYLPDKYKDSAAHPKIVWARCTVERTNAPYGGKYIAGEIAKISSDDIQESHAGEYPTALIIGPSPFIGLAHREILKTFPQAVLKKTPRTDVSILDAYKRLAFNAASNLGLRILLQCQPPDEAEDLILKSLKYKSDLSSLLSGQYLEPHLKIAQLIRRLIDGESLTASEEMLICNKVGSTINEIKQVLQIENPDDESPEDSNEDSSASNQPSVVCTSLVGAKGLSGGHVFLVGLNNEHFPKNPSAITNDEICCFLVGLSRTRKECHLISCDHFGASSLKPSIFLSWIQQHLVNQKVDANYFKHTAP